MRTRNSNRANDSALAVVVGTARRNHWGKHPAHTEAPVRGLDGLGSFAQRLELLLLQGKSKREVCADVEATEQGLDASGGAL